MRALLVLVVPALLLLGCDGGLVRSRPAPSDAGPRVIDAPGATTDAGSPTTPDAPSPPPGLDAAPPPGLDAGPPPPSLPPPAAGLPDHSAVIVALAAERPDLLDGSCVAMGGTNDFLFEAVRRLRALDPRWGLTIRSGAMLPDRAAYFRADGAPEGRSEIWVVDFVMRHCARPGIDAPAAPGWGDDTAAGGTWTIAPLDGSGPPDPPPTPTILPLPDMGGVVRDLAAERPDLLAASCVADGGNNEFLFELVRRLRRIDTRWGLNWKRAVVGDMSQDVVDYYYGPGDPFEGSWDTYVVDVIGGHCGPTPSAAWIDVTALGTRNALWTLAGRTDLGP